MLTMSKNWDKIHKRELQLTAVSRKALTIFVMPSLVRPGLSLLPVPIVLYLGTKTQ